MARKMAISQCSPVAVIALRRTLDLPFPPTVLRSPTCSQFFPNLRGPGRVLCSSPLEKRVFFPPWRLIPIYSCTEARTPLLSESSWSCHTTRATTPSPSHHNHSHFCAHSISPHPTLHALHLFPEVRFSKSGGSVSNGIIASVELESQIRAEEGTLFGRRCGGSGRIAETGL